MQVAAWYQETNPAEREQRYEERLSDIERRLARIEEELRLRDRRRWDDEEPDGRDTCR